MKLNEWDLNQLHEIANGIEKTLEITDLYLSMDMVKTLRMLIRKALKGGN